MGAIQQVLAALVGAGGGGGGGTGPQTARYWQFVGIVVDVALLEISELQLLDGATVVSGGVTITSSDVPGFGAVTDLNDGNLSTRPYWTKTVAEDPGFYIRFDLGSPTYVDGFKIGAFDNSQRYPQLIALEYSSDASTWFEAGSESGLSYPGNNTLSSTFAL